MRWPRQELETARPLRTSPLYDLLAAARRRVRQQEWLGARQLLQARPTRRARRTAWAGPTGCHWVIEEQRATREAVALYDQSSFAKLLLQGRDALAVLQRLCANEIDVPVDRMVYTALLNERGGFESDLTVIRLAADRFLIVTGSAQATRDADWIARHIGADEHALLTDVSALCCVLGGDGPEGARAAGARAPDDLSPEALKFAHTREIDLGHARVRAARMSYVGGPGFELYVPVEMTRHVYLALHEAGAELGLRGRRLLRARRAAHRSRPPRLGRRTRPRRDAVRGRAGRTPSSWTRPATSSARRRCWRRRASRCARSSSAWCSTRPTHYAWGGEALVDRRRGGRRTVVGRLGPEGRALRGPGLCARRRGATRAPRHAGAVDLWGERSRRRRGTLAAATRRAIGRIGECCL